MKQTFLLRAVAFMVTLACALGASAAEAYACYTPSNTTLTFYYDNLRSSRSGTTYDLNTELMFPDWNNDSTNAKVTQVIFHQSFANTCPTNTYAWFEGMSRLQSIVNINYLNTSEVTYMSYMFQGCTGLTSLDLTHFNTANVKSMSYMFNNCSGLMSIDVRSFNTSKVGNMYSMFAECTGLTSLDLGSFDTSQLRLSSLMFDNCSNLRTIYASDDFNMAGVTSDNMFSGCTSLVGGQGTVYSGYHTNGNYAHIDGGSSNPGYFTRSTNEREAYACYTPENTTLTFYYDNLRSSRSGNTYDMNKDVDYPGWWSLSSSITDVVFDLSFTNARPTSTYEWFYGMENLTTIVGIEYLNTSEVTNMCGMFYGCSGLRSLDLSSFNTAQVINMNYMFYHCSNLTSLDLSSFNTPNLITTFHMFNGCSSLTNLDISRLNTEQVTDLRFMFQSCSNLTSLDLSSFNTAKVTHMSGMFYNCSNLTSIYVGNGWSTHAVTYSVSMFEGCTSLVGGMGTTYDASHIDKTYAHIDGGPSNPGYFTEMAPVAYACYTESNTTLTFYYDKLRLYREGRTYNVTPDYQLVTGVNAPGWAYDGTNSDVTRVVFDPSFADARPTYTSGWFYYMTNLQSITGIENLDTRYVCNMSDMFRYCSSLTSLDVSGFNTTNVYNMSNLFDGCCNLGSLNLSGWNTSKVENMQHMFKDCSSLTTLDLNSWDTSDLTYLVATFYGCSGLTSLNLSSWNTSKVTTMELMFYNCSNLASIYVYNGWNTNMVNVSTDMFLNCTSLVGGKGTTYDAGHVDKTYARIDRGPGTPGYFRQGYSFCVDGIYYNITGSNTVDVASDGENSYSGIVTIPSSVGYNGVTYQVTGIGNDAFYNCSDLDSVSIPPTVTAIRHDAFYNCSVLEHVTLPAGLTTIGDNAFHLCWNLRDVTIPDNVEYIGVGAFMECSNLASVVIGNSVTSIGQQAFDHCTSLTSVVIPNSVTTIGKKAFYGCSNLENAVIGSGVTSIGSQAFYSCTNLRNITCRSTTPPTMAASDVFDNPAYTYATLFVPNGSLSAYQSANWWRNFTTISDQKFYDFAVNGIYYLITSGNTVEVSFRDAGLNTYSGNVTVPETVSYGGVTYQVTGIGTGAFANCANLTGVTLPSTVTYISDLAFMSCPSLGSVTLPNSLLTIGKRAFRDCTGLTSVTIPNSVTSIGMMAFDRCTGLTSVVIGSSVTFIGSYAFDDCDALRDVTCLASTPPVMENAGVFNDDTYADGTLTIPEASQSAYHSANWWKNFSHVSTFVPEAYACYTPSNTTLTFYYDNQRSRRPGTVYSLNTGSNNYNYPGWYSNAANVTRVVFDPSFSEARPTTTDYWFYNMAKLTTITGMKEYLNTSQVTYMRGMFRRCSSLTSIDLRGFNTANVTTMYQLFDGCSGLTRVDLSGFNTANVTVMSDMFSGCSGLTSIDLSNLNTAKVTETGGMFMDCSGLTSLDLSNFNTANVTYMASMFRNCTGLRNLDLSNLNTSKVTDMNYMFYNCSSLTSLDLTDLNTANVTNMSCMFYNCSSLTNLDLSSFNTSSVTSTNQMFVYCTSLTSLDLSSFNTAATQNAYAMFAMCSQLTTIYVSDLWSTDAMTSYNSMFASCRNLVGGMGTTYDANHVDKTYARIDGGPSNPGYFTAKGGTALRGDVNGNNEVTIADVSALIDYLLTGDTTGINMAAADCNGLDGVTIADVSALIDYLLTGSW
ncbi:MAG: BspA family leucine-rich repeat surface protein [Muribaculaceae bacterium]|nr:BspA family leucine-rich repeat surface protein [Muribaculaceae bacterium]